MGLIMKLVVGQREYNLTWRDGVFAGGLLLVAAGLGYAFGWGVVAAAGGGGLMLASRMEST